MTGLVRPSNFSSISPRKILVLGLIAILVALTILFVRHPKIAARPFNRMVSLLEPDKARADFLPCQDFPYGRVLEKSWREIRDDLRSESLGNIYAQWESQKEEFWEGWRTTTLRLFGQDHPRAQELNPTLWNLVKDHPEIDTVLISRLKPGKKIPEHRGPYQGLMRYHLGLQIPENTDSHIVLNGVKYNWSNGEGQLFNECHKHHVDNPAFDRDGRAVKEDRIILFLDVVRPFRSPWLNKLNQFQLKMARSRPKWFRPLDH